MKTGSKPHGPLPTHLLVAVDSEGLADHAVRAGAALAQRLDARLSFVHAIANPLLEWGYVESPRAASTKSGLLDTVAAALATHVGKLLSSAGYVGPGGDFVHVDVGRPAKVIDQYARAIEADCIVVGRLHERGAFDFGSTTRAVIGSSRSVWSQPVEYKPIHRILVPVDLSPASLGALKNACALARRLQARVTAIHCFDSRPILVTPLAGYPEIGAALPIDEMRAGNEKAFREAMSSFAWNDTPHETSFFEARPEDKIVELQQQHDLIALSTHGRTGLAAALLGHVAYSVLKHARIPVWAMREV